MYQIIAIKNLRGSEVYAPLQVNCLCYSYSPPSALFTVNAAKKIPKLSMQYVDRRHISEGSSNSVLNEKKIGHNNSGRKGADFNRATLGL